MINTCVHRRRGQRVYQLPKVVYIPVSEQSKTRLIVLADRFEATQAELGLAIIEQALRDPAATLRALLLHRQAG